MDTLRKIAKALKTSEEWLLEGADESMSSAPEVDRSAATAPTQTDMMRDIPVMGTARGSAIHEDFEGFDINGPVDYVHRPPALAGAKDIYAIYVAGDSMAPQHSAGELRFAHPHRPVQPGCTIIIQTRKENGDPGQAYIKNLVRRSAGKVTVEQINPPATIDIPTESIVKMHRVLTLNELFGI
ncbi:S24 family peptidase [Breoghania sp. L-A4]|uniref:S24 family peptidase n=1 Tax=Breoghania sp. L-A4 TaxID=2304600 RepID=UPI000E35AF3E|nr:S24 family peptidase [Breoghania sp. L-A4]AXS39781.1 helix-turn-helix transcriptional regulator [Breoghania sp. L-A4]